MATKITAYKTEDGEIFLSEKDASNHEVIESFRNNYYDNKLYGNYQGSYVDWGDLIHYVKENKELFQAVIDMDCTHK